MIAYRSNTQPGYWADLLRPIAVILDGPYTGRAVDVAEISSHHWARKPDADLASPAPDYLRPLPSPTRPASAAKGGGALIHGIGAVRDASKPQTPAEIYSDLMCLTYAVSETPFPEPLKLRISDLIVQSERDLRPLLDGSERNAAVQTAARIQQKFEQLIMRELTAAQIEQFNRRTVVLGLQMLMLGDGWHGFLDETAQVAQLNLSAEQQRQLEAVIENAEQNTRDARGRPGVPPATELATFMEARRRLREVLTPYQREAWDNWCYTTFMAAAEPAPKDTAK